jgi:low density lipoprotein receptor-related protein 5/6
LYLSTYDTDPSLPDFIFTSTGPQHFLLLARRTDIRRISLDTPDHTDVVLPLTGIKHGMAVEFDPVQKYVYWSDDQLDNIKRARIDGTGKISKYL